MSAHAKFSPSAAKRWLACPGSHLRAAALPPAPSSTYADEGTRLHAVAAAVIVGVWDGENMSQETLAEDKRFLAPYVKHCQDLRKRAGWRGVEQQVRLNDDLWGTADFVAVEGTTLHVCDLKTGRGVQVDPKENEQLLTYAWLAMVDAALPVRLLVLRDVVLTIAQPTIDGDMEIRTWTCRATHVVRHGRRLIDAMEAALAPLAPLVEGEHCRWCPVKPVCPRLQGVVADAPTGSVPSTLTGEQIAFWLDKADLVTTWVDSLRQHAHDVVSGGGSVPGYVLKPKRATRCWADEDKVLAYARDKKIKIFQPLKLLSPAMAEKVYGKTKLPPEVAEQIVSVSSGYNLVRDESAPAQQSAPTLKSALSMLKHRT